MLREVFIGKSPSTFHIHPIVKAFVISECFLWSSWNFITPIFAVYASTQLIGGDIAFAASGYSIHLVFRVLSELLSARYLLKKSDREMLIITIGGIALITFAYMGFFLTNTVLWYFVFYAIAGIGFGTAGPAKQTLFSTHLDNGKASIEWGLTDATSFISIALAAALGGFIAQAYGFQVLFILSAVINTFALIPYILYFNKLKGAL